MKTNFETNDLNAKIHGLSIMAGEVYHELYKESYSTENFERTENALEAYKSLRRLLPIVLNHNGIERHQGHTAAHYATQGY